MVPVLYRYDNKDVRTVSQYGNPWFVARDLCEVLEIANVSMALSRLDDDEKGISLIDTLGGRQRLSIVNESGMYSLVLTSRKPEAKAFRKWLTNDVIPAIRETGSYSTSTPRLSEAELIVKIAQSNLELTNTVVEMASTVVDLRGRVEVLESVRETITLSPSVAIEFAPEQPRVIVQGPSFASVKEFGLFFGITLADGMSQGIGRSASYRCKKQGTEVQYRALSSRGVTQVALYPTTILHDLLTERGLI
jgi:prophage antirepressor-like protein